MFVPDPRYPHGDIDEFEARLAALKKTQKQMAAPAAAPKAAHKPARPKVLCAQDHPLIASLIASLPAPDAVWSATDRADWLRAAESLFHLVYRAEDEVEVDVETKVA